MAEAPPITLAPGLEAATEPLLTPISEAEPSGVAVRYDDLFQELKAEVDRFSSATGEVDFERIVEQARAILRTKSKDLTTAGYLALGLSRTSGVAGVAEGLAVAEALVDRYWEGLHPQKPVRRRNALQFVADRLKEYVEGQQGQAPSAEERVWLESALGSLGRLQERAMAELQEQAPALSGLRAALGERLRRTPAPEPDQVPEEPAPSNPEPAATEAAAATAAPVAEPGGSEAVAASERPEGAGETVSFPELEPLLAPISEAEPSGVAVRYDDLFQELKAEVDRFSSATGEVDFERIVEQARAILRTKSKDLTTAGYLALGLSRTSGVAGVAEGLAVAEALVDRYWEGLHPQKPVRRRNALQFVADRLKEYVEGQQGQAPSAEERVWLESALGSLGRLQERAMAELQEQAPALSGLRTALDERLRRVPEPEPEPQPEPTPAAEAPATQESPPPSAAAPAAPAEIESAEDVVFAQLRIVRFLLEQDLTDPMPYRLVRAYFWGLIREMPEEGGYLYYYAPDAGTRDYYEQLFDQQAYEDVVRLGEGEFPQEPYYLWLTMQRYIHASLVELGADYAAAADAVLAETALLVNRLPELPQAVFQDDVPAADAATQEWIKTQVLPRFSSGGGGGAEDDPLSDLYKEARALAASDDLTGALALMKTGGEPDMSLLGRFRRMLYMGKLCLTGGQLELARAVLEGLDADVDRYSLAEWRPDLAASVWKDLYGCYSKIATERYDDGTLGTRMQAVAGKLLQVDVAQAVKWSGSM